VKSLFFVQENLPQSTRRAQSFFTFVFFASSAHSAVNNFLFGSGSSGLGVTQFTFLEAVLDVNVDFHSNVVLKSSFQEGFLAQLRKSYSLYG